MITRSGSKRAACARPSATVPGLGDHLEARRGGRGARPALANDLVVVDHEEPQGPLGWSAHGSILAGIGPARNVHDDTGPPTVARSTPALRPAARPRPHVGEPVVPAGRAGAGRSPPVIGHLEADAAVGADRHLGAMARRNGAPRWRVPRARSPAARPRPRPQVGRRLTDDLDLDRRVAPQLIGQGHQPSPCRLPASSSTADAARR